MSGCKSLPVNEIEHQPSQISFHSVPHWVLMNPVSSWAWQKLNALTDWSLHCLAFAQIILLSNLLLYTDLLSILTV